MFTFIFSSKKDLYEKYNTSIIKYFPSLKVNYMIRLKEYINYETPNHRYNVSTKQHSKHKFNFSSPYFSMY